MLAAGQIIAEQRSEVQFVLVVAPNRSPVEAAKIVEQVNPALNLRMVHHETREALAASDVAAVASGTATLEAALLSTPMVIVYRESALNWHILGRLITAEHRAI
jgi:lipid-A-disaccharide synthase